MVLVDRVFDATGSSCQRNEFSKANKMTDLIVFVFILSIYFGI